MLTPAFEVIVPVDQRNLAKIWSELEKIEAQLHRREIDHNYLRSVSAAASKRFVYGKFLERAVVMSSLSVDKEKLLISCFI